MKLYCDGEMLRFLPVGPPRWIRPRFVQTSLARAQHLVAVLAFFWFAVGTGVTFYLLLCL